MPLLSRWVILSACLAGVAGAIAGLVIGLFAYVPTAPFAAAEIGIPATSVGGVVGLVAGLIATALLRIRRHAVSARINRFQGHQRR
jgi:hypothetical protein